MRRANGPGLMLSRCLPGRVGQGARGVLGFVLPADCAIALEPGTKQSHRGRSFRCGVTLAMTGVPDFRGSLMAIARLGEAIRCAVAEQTQDRPFERAGLQKSLEGGFAAGAMNHVAERPRSKLHEMKGVAQRSFEIGLVIKRAPGQSANAAQPEAGFQRFNVVKIHDRLPIDVAITRPQSPRRPSCLQAPLARVGDYNTFEKHHFRPLNRFTQS